MTHDTTLKKNWGIFLRGGKFLVLVLLSAHCQRFTNPVCRIFTFNMGQNPSDFKMYSAKCAAHHCTHNFTSIHSISPSCIWCSKFRCLNHGVFCRAENCGWLQHFPFVPSCSSHPIGWDRGQHVLTYSCVILEY